jgi:hypothetical protein
MTHQDTGLTAPRRALTWLLLALLAPIPYAAFAAEQGGVPLEVLVTSAADDLMVRRTALNEDGVVEANVASVRDGVVYLEFEAAPAATALSAVAR